MGKKRNRTSQCGDEEKRVRRVESEGKTKLDKYKHLLYDDESYDDEIYDEICYHTHKIHRKSST
tara:strand:- start:380 stop:571 length:192 start_codon:yes stop_codon:yes gene_type:complete